MSIIYFPFNTGAGADSMQDRWSKMARLWCDTGVVNEGNKFEVYAGTGMLVKVKSGIAWLRGHYIESDAEETLAIGAADPSNPRIDRVLLRLDWSANRIDLAVLQGEPKASPSAPPLTQVQGTRWELSLAQVRVDAAIASIAANKVTDERAYTDAHASATSAVHGLPANVAPLGHRAGAGRYVQQGSANTPTKSNESTFWRLGDVTTITFPVAFSSTPVVLVSNQSDPAKAAGVGSVSTTEFQTNWLGIANAHHSGLIGYVAFGS